MTVKCIDKATQQAIVIDFQEGLGTISGMAEFLGVSRRTIIRVLEDHDVEPGIKRRPGARKPRKPIANEAQTTMDYVVDAHTLYDIHNRANLLQPKLSFIQRVFKRIATGLSLR